MTTLDTGNTSKVISGISFVSQEDWIVGKTTSSNQVTLSAGDSATVTVGSASISVSKSAGSNNNTLVINGSATTNQVNVGAIGNSGNRLNIDGSVTAAMARCSAIFPSRTAESLSLA